MSKSNHTIESNAGGVPGLHILYEAFSEAIEERLFTNEGLFLPSFSSVGWHYTYEEQHQSGKRCHSHTPSLRPFIPIDCYRICSLVRDSGLYPQLITPDYCLGITYPGPSSISGGSEFRGHFDSRYKWGESVVGVTLGSGCKMYFTQKGHKVELELPRRSIYIMTGDARTEWKHGISKMSSKNLNVFPEPPTWNPLGMRRSITLRSTKAYSDAVLCRELSLDPKNTILKTRIEEQNKYRPILSTKRLTNKELEVLRAQATEHVKILTMVRTDYRFKE